MKYEFPPWPGSPAFISEPFHVNEMCKFNFRVSIKQASVSNCCEVKYHHMTFDFYDQQFLENGLEYFCVCMSSKVFADATIKE